MREYLPTIREWTNKGQKIMLARVISTWGSSPRPVGSMMFINQEGAMTGSVSGGCVEGAVVKAALNLLSTEKESTIIKFGVSNDEAWQVGLSCGGQIEVLLQAFSIDDSLVWQNLKNTIHQNKPAILISGLTEGSTTNTILIDQFETVGNPITASLKEIAQIAYSERTSKTIELDHKSYFIQVFPRKSQLMIIGAAHITVDLVTLGNMFGFETIVIDPRGYFVDHTAFNDPPVQLINSYPSEVLHRFPLDAYTYCAILSHDPKIDDNALEVLLPKNIGYLGALGSKKTHAKRVARLKEKGFDQTTIDKIRAPIGVPIKAKSAREIALSIIAEIIEAKNHFH